MIGPNLPNTWLAVATLIVIGLLLIIFILFGAVMESMIAPNPDEETRDSFQKDL
jgi:hypothetical protein